MQTMKMFYKNIAVCKLLRASKPAWIMIKIVITSYCLQDYSNVLCIRKGNTTTKNVLSDN